MEAAVDLGNEFVERSVEVRPAPEDAWSFISNSWLKSYRKSSFAWHIPGNVYFEMHHRAIEGIRDRGATFLVATFTSESTPPILGWLCREGPVLHYCYVKRGFRRIGIASKLLAAAPQPVEFISHLTFAGQDFRAKRLPRALYNPYAL